MSAAEEPPATAASPALEALLRRIVHDPGSLLDSEFAVSFGDRVAEALGTELHGLGCDAVSAACGLEHLTEPFKKDLLRAVLLHLKSDACWGDGSNEERWAMGCQVGGGCTACCWVRRGAVRRGAAQPSPGLASPGPAPPPAGIRAQLPPPAP
jgi:hypothetical protein